MTTRRTIAERLLNAPHLPVAAYLIWVGSMGLATPEATRVAAGEVPDWFVYGWTGALLLGGLLIIAGAAGGRSRAESAGHGFHLAGLAGFAACATVGSEFGSSTVVILFALGSVSGLRLRQLGKQREAQEVVGDLLDGEPHGRRA